MKYHFTRRDFLKLSGLLPLSVLASRFERMLEAPQPLSGQNKNVLVIVFDAFSAYHFSMYGYQRETTPNLARLAERAVVYHNHYAGGSFTTPGTASLLTGTLPWTHRAFEPKARVAEQYASRNIFGAFENYYRIAYTHNGWANILLEECQRQMEELVPWESLFLRPYFGFILDLFRKDIDIASVGWTRNVNIKQYGYSYSLFLSQLYEVLRDQQYADLRKQFPRGIPSTGFADNDFLLENATDWIGKRLAHIPQPFFGYFHFLPPHGPYNTPLEFIDRFGHDGFKPIDKPQDIFTEHESNDQLLKKRTEYDEFLLYVDKEFGRLVNYLETSGLLENSWIVFTSDHGEMFERGISAHSTHALYQPLIRVPLLIFEPGRKVGMNIYTSTSAVDVLPTLSYVTGHNIPDWTEGVLLPPYASASPDPNRPIYVMKANENDGSAPLTRASTVIIKGRYKLLYYFGYVERGIDELIKLFDIEADPEELVDLYSLRKDIADELLQELKSMLAEKNKPYL
jgi:arylsulfatase